MIYVDKTQGFFNVTSALGAGDTENPPPVLLYLHRPGTNEEASLALPTSGIITGPSSVTWVDIASSLVPQTGTWNFTLFDNTDPGNQVELEKGILIATTTPIEKTQYGTDKKRGEYKGSE